MEVLKMAEIKQSETDKKIEELEQRILKLEQIEKKRRTMKIISICIKAFVYLIMLILLVKLFIFVKPYFDQLSGLNDLKNNFNLNGDNSCNIDLNQYLEGLLNY